MQDLIISMSTIPTRLFNIKHAIDSLLGKGVKVYVFIPKFFKRGNIKFNGKLPAFLKNNNSINVEVVDDCGPITKFIYALDIADKIITVDDDNVYGKDLVNNFLKYHNKYPGAALCSSGVRLTNGKYKLSGKVKNIDRPVDIVLGCHGVFYKSDFFTDFIYKFNDYYPAYYVDDIWISGNLAKNGIDRRCVPVSPLFINKQIKYVDCLATQNKKNDNNNRVIKKFKKFW